ncbi:GIY-YIG nuclease family protein [Rhodococcus sp. Eu-32]|uniref:GIY-YIG nuclease family protein n=1 Tax=Rhodococcus sp. Eu-32 TaxID=1017319 RepID=UPI000DF47891|nr:GIY-YIG nuclease family protein [Rhodococcus sp. Eu-32]RRQ26272.1 GIY-YIG nuclease family protein [Rhodococcus sp. Eu-32]
MAVIRDDSVRNHFVYRAFDAEGRLLYIGCTQNLKARWQQHRFANLHWVVQTHRLKTVGPLCYRTARAVEKAAIASESPRYGWTPERGQRLARKRAWVEQRRRELMSGKRPWEMEFDDYSAICDKAEDEANGRFPNLWNSDNHPTNGVPERYQPYLPYGDLALIN